MTASKNHESYVSLTQLLIDCYASIVAASVVMRRCSRSLRRPIFAAVVGVVRRRLRLLSFVAEASLRSAASPASSASAPSAALRPPAQLHAGFGGHFGQPFLFALLAAGFGGLRPRLARHALRPARRSRRLASSLRLAHLHQGIRLDDRQVVVAQEAFLHEPLGQFDFDALRAS